MRPFAGGTFASIQLLSYFLHSCSRFRTCKTNDTAAGQWNYVRFYYSAYCLVSVWVDNPTNIKHSSHYDLLQSDSSFECNTVIRVYIGGVVFSVICIFEVLGCSQYFKSLYPGNCGPVGTAGRCCPYARGQRCSLAKSIPCVQF